MPSLSTFFRKRRSLHTQPPNNDTTTTSHGDTNNNIIKPRNAARLTFTGTEAPSPAVSPPRGEADLGFADSSDETPTVATGPWRRHSQQHPPQAGTTGRLNRYVSTHDPFRRFRSRSTQFRFSGVGGGGSGPGVDDEGGPGLSWNESPEGQAETGAAGAQAQARTTWAQAAAAPQDQQQQQQQQQRVTEDWPLRTESPPSTSALMSARDASLAALQRPPLASARTPGREDGGAQLRRPNSEVGPRGSGEKHMHAHTNSSTSFASSGGPNKLQKLRRLPSLSLNRGFSRRGKKGGSCDTGRVGKSASHIFYVVFAPILSEHSLSSLVSPLRHAFSALGVLRTC